MVTRSSDSDSTIHKWNHTDTASIRRKTLDCGSLLPLFAPQPAASESRRSGHPKRLRGTAEV